MNELPYPETRQPCLKREQRRFLKMWLYAREHWTHPGESPPVGLILCAQKDHAVAHYALERLPNKVLAAEYRTALPDEETLVAEIEKTRRMLEGQGIIKPRN